MTGVQRIAGGKIVSLSGGHYPQLLVDLDASKPSPGIGDTYIATDTGKTYTCYVSGVWSLLHSPCNEGYENHMGTFDNIMVADEVAGGTALMDAANHQIDLSSITGAETRGGYKSVISLNPGQTAFEFNCKITNIVNGTGGYRNTCIGVMQANTAQDGVGLTSIIGLFFIQITDNSWGIWCVDTVASAGSGGSYTIVNGDLLTIKGNKAKFDFFINGSKQVSFSRAYAASEACYPMCYVAGTAGTTVARTVSCDYISWRIFT